MDICNSDSLGERDMLSSKTRRLEDSQHDLKAKLTGALMDKDRLVQEKAELHQKVQALELQLQREQRGKQGFNEQVCELHTELSQVKNQANREKKDNVFMKEEMLSMKELNEKLSSDLSKATERLQVTLNQQHELEADKLIRINQIAALETERLKLLGEKEELRKNVNDGVQDEIRALKERCCQHREQDLKNLEILRETEKAEPQIKILSLEQEVLKCQFSLQLLKDKDLHSQAKVVSNEHNPEDFKSLQALLEEYRKSTEKLTEERNHALQQLHDLDRFQQVKAVKESPPDTKKQKTAGLDLVDPNEQRKLVTEQLKNLFKERDQRGERSPVLPKRCGLLENGVQNPESIKHPLVAPAGSLASGLKTDKGTSSKTFADHGASKMADGEERTNAQMSAVRGEMENLKERNENVLEATVISPHQIETLKARSQPRNDTTFVTVPHLQNLVKGKIQQEKSLLGCKDGAFYARQIEICNSDVEYTEESNSGEETVDTPLLES